MPLNIIIRRPGTEAQRKKAVIYRECLKHYYDRECRDGTRIKLPPNATKKAIKELYASDPASAGQR
jgi:hypothetical protein